jgi:CHAD domain-containing protein
VKARKVKGLDPHGPLAENVARIVRVRADELHGFTPRALDAREVEALHDMRIAAKRLRYILELHAFNFGPYAATAAKRARDLQDLIGEIHDCDVTIPRVDELIERVRAHDVIAIRARAADAEDVDPALAAATPNADTYRGLEAMRAYRSARRELLYDRFLELWLQLGREGFRARLEFALTERPTITSPSQDDNTVAPVTDIPSGTT